MLQETMTTFTRRILFFFLLVGFLAVTIAVILLLVYCMYLLTTGMMVAYASDNVQGFAVGLAAVILCILIKAGLLYHGAKFLDRILDKIVA